MSEMIDRAAKALYINRRHVPFPVWETEIEAEKDYFRSAARAAIASMREPTAEMVENADSRLVTSADKLNYDPPVWVWQRMIDRALETDSERR